jgi:hypothetical protein
MAEPIKNVILGGLTYNANQVKDAKDNGNGTFTISFKTGETLTYPEQSPLREKPKEKQYVNGEMLPVPNSNDKYNSGIFYEVNPSVSLRVDDGWIYDDTCFTISDVMGATFKSNKDTVSHVTLDNCNNTIVNLAANNSRWYGDAATIKGGEGNEVILDKNDTAVINGKSIDGEGTAAQKDYPE